MQNLITPTRDIVGKVWLYVLVGIVVGAGIRGYVPEDALVSIMAGSRAIVAAV